MLDELLKISLNSTRCVVLTGAGISAESGVPTFRGKEGLWNKLKPEELATMDAFMANPKIVWEWYNWRRDLIDNVKPNDGHRALVELEKFFGSFTLITQNVDGLHEMAGSQNVLELHGNVYRNKCLDCNRPYFEENEIDPERIPTCKYCNGKIRPDIVWFGEMLDEEIIQEAFLQTEKADLFFSIGTSTVVHPAAALPVTAKQFGATLVEVNIDETPVSELSDFSFRSKSGEFLPNLCRELLKKSKVN